MILNAVRFNTYIHPMAVASFSRGGAGRGQTEKLRPFYNKTLLGAKPVGYIF